MIFDAHCHAWEHWPYDTGVPDPESRGSAEALLYEMDTHGVDRAAIVCARIGAGAGGDGFGNPENNDYVARFAAAHPDRIQVWADVDCIWRPEHHTPGAAARLVEEIERTGATGFTHYVDGETNDGWLRTDDAGEFFREAADRGLIASLAFPAPWFDDLRVIATDNPSLPILLHHLGHPKDADQRNGLLALAELPNIGVKVSGFNYNSASYWDYPYPDAQETFEAIHRAFGPSRVYWGSDFPASRDMLTYTQAIEVVREHASFLSAADLAALLGENLERLVANPRIAARSAQPAIPPPPPH